VNSSLITTGWGPLHTLGLNMVQSLNRYAVHDPGQVRLWKIVSIIGRPSVLRIAALLAVVLLEVRRRRDAAVLVAVAIGGAAAMSGIVKCWSTGAVNLSGKRHVCELFGCFGDSYGRSAVARLTLELTIANCAI